MLIEAINDERLYGQTLTLPFRSCWGQFRNVVSACSNEHISAEKVKIVIERIPGLFVASVVISPSLLLAGVGILAKWIDLSCRIDQFAHHFPAITYSLPLPLEINSRLGDRLIAYLHTKYVAEKYNLPIYLSPFKGAEFFAFFQSETLIKNPTAPKYFKRVVHLNSLEDMKALKQINSRESVLYVLSCSPLSRFPIDWESFKPRVKELLEVVKPHENIDIPEEAFSIALHIRTGGTYDRPDTSTMLPTKIPPMSYSIGELENLLLSDHTPKDRPLFIHIFTDDVDPGKIRRQIESALFQRNVFHRLGNQKITISHTENPKLIDDVANMTRFDCLIRPDSNLSGTLSKAAEHLGVEVFPTHFKVNQAWTEITIDRVERVNSAGQKEQRTTSYTMPAIKRLPVLFYRVFHRYAFAK